MDTCDGSTFAHSGTSLLCGCTDNMYVFVLLTGLLLKRCTLLLPTKERLKYIHKVLSGVSSRSFHYSFYLPLALTTPFL